MECRRCGSDASGNFCSNCGASLEEHPCPACDAPVPPGSRFCTSCGVALQGAGAPSGAKPPASAGASRESQDLAWWISGGLLVVVVVLVTFLGPWAGGDDPPPQPAAPGAQGTDPMAPAPQVDLSTMTDREAADRLFDRIMMANEQGDEEEVTNFLPMALDAYELARPLDADGHFHVAVLQNLAGDHEAALAEAETVLEEDPNHLLNLSAAAEAAVALGDNATAEEYYSRILEVFDSEVDRDLPEYREHVPLLPSIRDEAAAFMAGVPGG